MLTAPRLRRIIRLLGWNALLLGVGLALIAIAGETYFRLTKPFMERQLTTVFVPGVGYLFSPGSEVRWTNYLDFWATARANRLGFLDRAPVRPEQAAAGCHISIIGDSFVAARQVPIADKFQVRLTQLAGQQRPDLSLTASAYGRGGSGQFGQLPLYDQFARQLNPNLVVLVFYRNDFIDNSPFLSLVYWGRLPDWTRFPSAPIGPDDALQWRSPVPDDEFALAPAHPPPLVGRALYFAGRVSWFAQWLAAKHNALHREYRRDFLPERLRRLEIYRQHYDAAGLLDDWQPSHATLSTRQAIYDALAADRPAPAYQQAVTLTSRALGEFQSRAARDGAALVILSESKMGGHDSPWFNLLSRLAAAHNIPVINLHDYILRQNGDLAAASWAHDSHWTPQGHQWAAAALLEWLQQNPAVCQRDS